MFKVNSFSVDDRIDSLFIGLRDIGDLKRRLKVKCVFL